MMLSHDRITPQLRVATAAHTQGFTLIELLVVLALLSLAMVSSGLLASGMGAVEERGSAQILQSGVAAAQLWQQWQVNASRVEIGATELGLCFGADRQANYTSPGRPSISSNVSSWRAGTDALALDIAGPLASPDSGGTVRIGTRSAVVIRPESGFTRREP